MSIRIFVTGGTFDKEYDELEGRLFFKDSHVSEMLKLGRCKLAVDIRTLMMIDSLEMTDDDRQLILKSCQSAKEERIVVTHGTDTMEQTARVLGAVFGPSGPTVPATPSLSAQVGGRAGKVIVLTGAMIPYKFGSSDGLFNLGSALAFAQSLPFGVYVAMNGRVFPWFNVRKNRQTGEFGEIV